MALHKKKYVEVLSPRIVCFSQTPQEASFADVLSYMSTRKINSNDKEYIVRIYKDSLDNCIEGIVITGQNKDIPPKRDNETGKFSALPVNVHKEKLSYGNAFLYDKKLNVLFFERNKNGCYVDTLAKTFVQIWNSDEDNHEGIKIQLDFLAILRKGEYERAVKMKYYKEFYAEFTNPTAILEEMKEDNSSLYGFAKRCALDASKAKSDRFEIKMSTFGRYLNKEGLSIRMMKEHLKSVRQLLLGGAKVNVEKVRIKGYSSDPDAGNSIQTIDLVADVFKPSFNLTSKSLNSDLQETERRQGMRNVYNHIMLEVKDCIGNE